MLRPWHLRFALGIFAPGTVVADLNGRVAWASIASGVRDLTVVEQWDDRPDSGRTYVAVLEVNRTGRDYQAVLTAAR